MDVKEEKDFMIVLPSGKLDTISAPDFSEELLKLLDKKPKGCVIDLHEVSFLSSSGLQALLVGAKTSKKQDIKYGVCGMNEMVNDVFMLSGFDRFVPSFKNSKDAISKL